MGPSSAGRAEWCREGVRQTFKLLLKYSTTIETPLKYHKNRKGGQPRTACGAEECPMGPSSAGKGWGKHWGTFKLLYYH